MANAEDSLQIIAMLEQEMKELKTKLKVHDTIMLLLGCQVLLFFIVCVFGCTQCFRVTK